VLAYDLRTGTLRKRVEAPRGYAFNDLTLDAAGDLVVADANGGGLYRLAANGDALHVVDTKDFVSPLGAAYAPGSLFVADYLRGIAVMHGNTVRWLPMAKTYALEGTDGLYEERGWLIAVQNGFQPERVVAFKLASTGRVIAQTTIESGSADLDPTHGVVVGDAFYYLKNTGWNQLGPDGKIKAGAKLTPALVMRATLP
jgi:hypothetical protein